MPHLTAEIELDQLTREILHPQGVVVSCNRKAQDKITASYSGHQGPVYSIARNPFFPKYFMSIGDWTARIWYEDLRSPIITSKYHQSYLVGGKWSPVRPGVLFTIKSDGAMDVWDYFYRQNDPTLTVKVGDSSLSAFDIQVRQTFPIYKNERLTPWLFPVPCSDIDRIPDG